MTSDRLVLQSVHLQQNDHLLCGHVLRACAYVSVKSKSYILPVDLTLTLSVKQLTSNFQNIFFLSFTSLIPLDIYSFKNQNMLNEIILANL